MWVLGSQVPLRFKQFSFVGFCMAAGTNTVLNEPYAPLSSIEEEDAAEALETQLGGLDGGNQPIDLETGLRDGQTPAVEIPLVALNGVHGIEPQQNTAALSGGGFQKFVKDLSATCTQTATSAAILAATAGFVGLRSMAGTPARVLDILSPSGKELAARAEFRNALGPAYCKFRLDPRLPNFQKTMALLDGVLLVNLYQRNTFWACVGGLSSLCYASYDFKPLRDCLTNWLAGTSNPSPTENPSNVSPASLPAPAARVNT